MSAKDTLRVVFDLGPAQSLPEFAESIERLGRVLSYCLVVAAVRDPGVAQQVSLADNKKQSEVHLVSLAAGSQTLRQLGRYADEDFLLELAEAIHNAVRGQRYVIQQTSYSNPWETVIRAVSDTGSVPLYALTGLLIAKQALTSVMEWQKHRVELEERKHQLESKRGGQHESGSLAPITQAHSSETTVYRSLSLQETSEPVRESITKAELALAGDPTRVPAGISYERERAARSEDLAEIGQCLHVELCTTTNEKERDSPAPHVNSNKVTPT
jgi:hypothetical protein